MPHTIKYGAKSLEDVNTKELQMSIFDKFKSISAPTLSGPVEYLIVGLGNPGTQYEFTRHNAGFLSVQTLAERLNVKVDRAKYKSLCADVMISGKRCLIMKPQTFMNKSGEAVVEAMNFYKIPAEKVIVIYDDISLEPSHIRIRRKGSDGGHNGIKNIIYLTGKDTFPRIKVGVGKKPHPKYDLADWVLSSFTDDEKILMVEAFEKAASSVELIVAGKIDEAMNKYNS